VTLPPSDPGPDAAPGPGAAFFRALVEQDAIVVTGPDGVIRYATPPASRILGNRAAAGTRLQDLVGDAGRQALAAALDRDGPATGADTWQLPGDDEDAAYVQVSASDLRADPSVDGIIFTFRDVTGWRQREDRLRSQALRDPLGLANRTLFNERAELALAGRGRLVTVMMGDLDGFKGVNDALGHLAGDELLVAVAGRVKGAVRATDVVARFGGDEFAVLLEGLPGRDAARAFAARIVAAVDAPFALAAGPARVGISVGFAVAGSGGGTSVAELVGRADRALYAAKAAGKRTWREYVPGMAAETPAPAGLGEVSKLGFPAVLSRVVPPWPRGLRPRGGGDTPRSSRRRSK
jgi:diguanylate cyclase (GGDEF)-like protein